MVGLLSSAVISVAASLASAAEKLRCAPPQRMAQTSGSRRPQTGRSASASPTSKCRSMRTSRRGSRTAQAIRVHLRSTSTETAATSRRSSPIFRTSLPRKGPSILLTPSGEGIIPGIKTVNDAGVPLIEVNNKAGFGRSEVNVLTYVSADDVRVPRQASGQASRHGLRGKKAKVAYVMGFAGTSPQILRAKGWDEFRALESAV